MKNDRESREKFVIDYLKVHHTADALNAEFHDLFYERFGGKRKLPYYGAQLVYKAQRLLASMERQGILDRIRQPLPEHLSGFPNWVYVYGIKTE